MNDDEAATTPEPERITPLEWFHLEWFHQKKLDEQAAKRAAGFNSDKLCAKRRKQMLEGKLGREARITATKEFKALLDAYPERPLPPGKLRELREQYLTGKDPKQNAA